MQNIFNNKLVPVALIAALLGSVLGAVGFGAISTSAAGDNQAAQVTPLETSHLAELFTDNTLAVAEAPAAAPGIAPQYLPAAYVNRQAPAKSNASARRNVAPRRAYVAGNQVFSSHARANRQVVYTEPKKRSFWSKHRDKLTVAMGTGAGAAIGGIAGGKKGALIGALAGAGGSALYTYKIRKRNPRN